MKLSDLLTSVLGQLTSKREYGLPLLQLLQSQIAHDPSQVIEIKDVDGRGTSIKLYAKGKQVRLREALLSAIDQSRPIELDMDREGGLRIEAKGLAVTAAWRKRTSEERIQDVQDRINDKSPFEDITFVKVQGPYRYTPTGRLTFPALGALDERGARHAAKFSTSIDFSALEERALAHYAGEWVKVGVQFVLKDGRVVADLTSLNVNESFFDDEHRFRGAKLNDIVPHWLNSRCEDVELPGEFTRARGIELPIVGSCYRSGVEQDTLRRKNVGNMVVVTREPTNASDSRALAVWAWDHTGMKAWRHVGYVPRALNAGIEEAMRKMGPSVVLVGEMLDHGSTSNPRFKVTAARRYLKSIRKMGG